MNDQTKAYEIERIKNKIIAMKNKLYSAIQRKSKKHVITWDDKIMREKEKLDMLLLGIEKPISRKTGNCGPNNGRWRGGVSQYPDVDGKRYNHSEDNLLVLCYKCHHQIHHKQDNLTTMLSV